MDVVKDNVGSRIQVTLRGGLIADARGSGALVAADSGRADETLLHRGLGPLASMNNLGGAYETLLHRTNQELGTVVVGDAHEAQRHNRRRREGEDEKILLHCAAALERKFNVWEPTT